MVGQRPLEPYIQVRILISQSGQLLGFVYNQLTT